jgi:FkbM family methyltransferase
MISPMTLTPRWAVSLAYIALLATACNPESRQGPPPAGESREGTPHEDLLSTEVQSAGELHSQGKEELIIRDFFGDRREGFFVDVGCAWPVIYSNTYYLEKQLGWSGIAIDALPEFEPSWKKRRPKSKFFNYLITDHSDSREPFYRSELKGISSIRKPVTGPAGNERAFEEIQVPTITLTDLLEQNGVSKIDFLSIDIEGAELLALAGFDIGRFKPELICIEAKPANREKILEYFAANEYERIDRYLAYDRTNYYFARSPR